MKIYILNDNRPKTPYGSEHGLSWLVEAGGKKVLFDTSPSDIFLRNAEKMGLSLDDVDTVVLSHGHYDHGNGLVYLDRTPPRRLICHPEAFAGKYHKGSPVSIGLPLSREEAAARFDLTETREPYRVTDEIIFLGEIPRNNDFESKRTAFVREDGQEDFMPDDSGLAVITPRGLVVISGCGHAGICNITAHAVQVTGIQKIRAVMGGFHLKYDDEVTRRTVACLKKMGVETARPSHCTELPALARFYEHFGNEFVRSGDVLEI